MHEPRHSMEIINFNMFGIISPIVRRDFLQASVALGAVLLPVLIGMKNLEWNDTSAAQRPEEAAMHIIVNANDQSIVFALNDSQAARDLHRQLPLDITVKNYSNNEKIFYPPEKLDTAGTPLARDVQPGTLAYYAPWGDVVMFHGPAAPASGLYELGHAVEGGEHIKTLSGTIWIEKEDTAE